MNMYKITDVKGVTLGFQYGDNANDAVRVAKMYGMRSAAFAELYSSRG